ncbi:MAG: cobalamin B12-binding domain-containing protein [Erysipelotrichaceae bacterium]|jgi:methanogenic corrinoid protein MtbC1
MSLLMNYNDPRYIEIARLVFEEQFKRDVRLDKEMDERRKRLMYDDVFYNLSFLLTAIHFKDVMIFEGYAKWIYELLCNLMKDLDRDRIATQMVEHYQILSEVLTLKAEGLLSKEELNLADDYLKRGIKITCEAITEIEHSETFLEGDFYEVRKEYLNALITNQTKRAYQVISEVKKQQVPITRIFEDILSKTMYEIGDLWHRNIITVDKEHYATSVTQTIVTGFYDEIFDRPRKNKTLVACAIGSELHEMGIRMLSDIMEYSGWDTFYLGAALPEKAILLAIEEHKPDVIALSVTMPPYLSICENIVKSIRKTYPDVRIAVGGQAFRSTDKLWEKWDIDYYSKTAREFSTWADTIFQ